jgi:hypothetical protein
MLLFIYIHTMSRYVAMTVNLDMLNHAKIGSLERMKY